MTVLRVPYHLDEYLPGLDLPLESTQTITAELPAGDTWTRLTVLYRRVADAVARAAGDGRRPVVLSGDCTTSLGIVAGLQHAGLDPGIVWFDAHGDVQTLETTASGYLGGLPLRILAGYRPELIAGGLELRPVPEHRIVLVGARDLDPPEVTYLASAAISQIEVAALDLRQVAGRAAVRAPGPRRDRPGHPARPEVPGTRRCRARRHHRSAGQAPGHRTGRRGGDRVHLVPRP